MKDTTLPFRKLLEYTVFRFDIFQSFSDMLIFRAKSWFIKYSEFFNNGESEI